MPQECMARGPRISYYYESQPNGFIMRIMVSQRNRFADPPDLVGFGCWIMDSGPGAGFNPGSPPPSAFGGRAGRGVPQTDSTRPSDIVVIELGTRT